MALARDGQPRLQTRVVVGKGLDQQQGGRCSLTEKRRGSLHLLGRDLEVLRLSINPDGCCSIFPIGCRSHPLAEPLMTQFEVPKERGGVVALSQALRRRVELANRRSIP